MEGQKSVSELSCALLLPIQVHLRVSYKPDARERDGPNIEALKDATAQKGLGEARNDFLFVAGNSGVD